MPPSKRNNSQIFQMAFFFHPDDSDIIFNDPEMADEDGVLAVGGNLSLQNLLEAYIIGAFPWYSEGDPVLWHHPATRMILFPEKLKISHSMRNVINQGKFRFTFNKAFPQVIRQCRTITRRGQPGTWITNEIEEAYTNLFNRGFTQSAEAWNDKKLVGGLYGVLLGQIFFGESMFSLESNASKFAFIKMVQLLQKNGIRMIDCQIPTPHLKLLGAEEIPRKEFVKLMKKFGVQN